MFVDQVNIFVKAGDGGKGMVAFRREKYVPDGGPAGGDGGHGGDVIFEVEEGLRTLVDFRYSKKFIAHDGEKGMSKGMHGRKAKPLIVKVPPGTIVFDAETDTVIADLTEHGQQATIAKGGRGGRGNCRFATPANPAPEIAENGEPGQERELRLELKLLADVGLVGFPSVGKSTLLSVVSSARPKIGAYHFTTITPNLGVVKTADDRSFVMADLPGLIEGASQGVGLGHQFLRHIERTKVIVHMIDMSGMEGRDPFEDYTTINRELESYNLRLLERPQVVVANKMDMPDAAEHLEEFKKKVGDYVKVFPISALAQDGLRNLLIEVANFVDTTPEFPLDELEEKTATPRVVYRYEKEEKGYQIHIDEYDRFVITGPRIEKLFKMTNFDHDESIKRFARQMRQMGVDDDLRKLGAEDGSVVAILDFEFEFVE